MQIIPIIRHLKTYALPLLLAVTFIGCSKKTTPSAVVPPSAESTATPTAVPQSTTQAAPATAHTDIRQSFADADAALKAKAYEKAVQAMLAAQQQRQLTEQQAQEARNRMIGLQQNLAAAVASGDPSAKAAVELLRRSSMMAH